MRFLELVFDAVGSRCSSVCARARVFCLFYCNQNLTEQWSHHELVVWSDHVKNTPVTTPFCSAAP